MAIFIQISKQLRDDLNELYDNIRNLQDNEELAFHNSAFGELMRNLEEVVKKTQLSSKDADSKYATFRTPLKEIRAFGKILSDIVYDDVLLGLTGLSQIKLHTLIERLEDEVLADSGKTIRTTNVLHGLVEQLKKNQQETLSKLKDSDHELTTATQSALSQIKRQYSKSINDLDNRSKELFSAYLNDLESKTVDSASRLKETSTHLRYELTEEIEERINNGIETSLDNAIVQINNRAEEVVEDINGTVEGLKNKVEDQVNDFVRLNNSLRKTLNFVASDALADSSIKQAEEERKTADRLRFVGVLWLLLGIVLFLQTFDYNALIDKAGTPQYTLILLRSFFLIVGITPGFYLLRESARHRTDERRYRQKGIQLATIDGYFSEFESEQRNSVKKDLSKHYFHGDDHFVDSSSVDKIESSYSKVFDTVLKAANKKTAKSR